MASPSPPPPMTSQGQPGWPVILVGVLGSCYALTMLLFLTLCMCRRRRRTAPRGRGYRSYDTPLPNGRELLLCP